MTNSWFDLGIMRNIQQSIHNNPIIAITITIIELGTLLIAISISGNKTIMLSLYASAFFSVIPMIISPGARNMIFAIWVVIGIGVYFISTVQFKLSDIKKCFWIFITFILLLRAENYAFYLKDAFYIEQQRKAIIESYAIESAKANSTGEHYLILPMHCDAFIGNTNSTYYTDSIINHYKLPLNTKVLFDDGFLLENIEIKIESNNTANIYVNQIQRYGDSFTYYFNVYCNGTLIESCDETLKNKISVQLKKSGLYTATCTIKNNTTNELINIESKEYEIDIQ